MESRILREGYVRFGEGVKQTYHMKMWQGGFSLLYWLITMLANQAIMIHNLRHPDEKRPLLTEEAVELLTTPFELAGFKDAISQAMFLGTKRDIESEGGDRLSDDSKNAEAAG